MLSKNKELKKERDEAYMKVNLNTIQYSNKIDEISRKLNDESYKYKQAEIKNSQLITEKERIESEFILEKFRCLLQEAKNIELSNQIERMKNCDERTKRKHSELYCDQSDENKTPNIPKRQITDKSIRGNIRSLVDSKVDYQIYSQRTFPSTIDKRNPTLRVNPFKKFKHSSALDEEKLKITTSQNLSSDSQNGFNKITQSLNLLSLHEKEVTEINEENEESIDNESY